MIDLLKRYKGWVILEYFLIHPTIRVHLNEMSRKLRISTFTAMTICNEYLEDSILNMEKSGNIHQYYLNEEDSRIKTLKKFVGPYLISDKKFLKKFLSKNKNILSIAIYGSFASGEYDDNSDLDILILTSDEKKIETSDLREIGKETGKEIQTTSMSFFKWRKLEKSKNKFFKNVKNNHILVWGENI